MVNRRTGGLYSLLGIGWFLLIGCGTTAEGQEAPLEVAQDTAAASADAAPTPSLPGVDLSPLNAAQQAQAMKIFADNGCGCGCGMNIVDCRTKDPGCGRSPRLAAQVVALLAEGKGPDEVVKAVFAAPSAPAAAPAGAPGVGSKDMEFDVSAGDSYAVGPAGAAVTIVTWLDYQ